jgi:hypothetical protein
MTDELALLSQRRVSPCEGSLAAVRVVRAPTPSSLVAHDILSGTAGPFGLHKALQVSINLEYLPPFYRAVPLWRDNDKPRQTMAQSRRE